MDTFSLKKGALAVRFQVDVHRRIDCGRRQRDVGDQAEGSGAGLGPERRLWATERRREIGRSLWKAAGTSPARVICVYNITIESTIHGHLWQFPRITTILQIK